MDSRQALTMDEMAEKQAYAAETNGPGTAWHVCGCHRCPYAFTEVAFQHGGYDVASVNWKLLRAARSAFKRGDNG